MAFPTDKTVSRLGQMNKQGDSRALFQKLYTGEVMTSFHDTNIALGLTRSRTIRNGKSASFPLIGKNSASYHTPGQLIDTNKIAHSERIVTIDDVAISPVFIADIDDAMRNYEVRSQYSTESGQALAELIDRNIFRMLAKAAAITDFAAAQAAGLNPIPEETYTQNITLGAAGDELNGAKLVDAIFKARTQLRNAKVREKAVVVLPPEQYEALVNVQDTNKVTWMNRDVGGVGSMAEGTIPRVAGLPIYESTQLPTADESTGLATDPEPLADATVGSGNQAKYRGDYSNLVGLIFTQSAVATTKLMDISIQHIPEPLRLGHNILAKMAVGHDILRPVCAIAIYKRSA
jgi:hypothetical protein